MNRRRWSNVDARENVGIQTHQIGYVPFIDSVKPTQCPPVLKFYKYSFVVLESFIRQPTVKGRLQFAWLNSRAYAT